MDAYLNQPTRVIFDAVETAMQNSMVWGMDDCCLWVANIILQLTEVDLAEPFRGYTDEEGAQKALETYFGAPCNLSLVAVKRANELNLRPVVWPYHGRLVGICPSRLGPVLALRFQEKWLARTQAGIAHLPDWNACLAWEWPCLQS